MNGSAREDPFPDSAAAPPDAGRAFAAIDAHVREELRQWLRALHDEVHVTSLFATHDQQEVFALADGVHRPLRGDVDVLDASAHRGEGGRAPCASRSRT